MARFASYAQLERLSDEPFGILAGYASSDPPIGGPVWSRLADSIYPILELCMDADEAARMCTFQGPVELENHLLNAKLLISRGADVNVSDDTTGASCLHFAAGSGSLELCNVLRKAGARVAARDRRLRTPLWWAIGDGHLDVCRTLLEQDPRVARMPSIDQMLPIHDAAFRGDVEIVELLLLFIEARTGADARGYQMRSPLHVAASQGHFEVCQVLLAGKADPLKKCAHGRTALHYAAECGLACSRLDLCSHLASCGPAVLRIRDASGLTPLDLAAKNACLTPELKTILQPPQLRAKSCTSSRQKRPSSATSLRRKAAQHSQKGGLRQLHLS